MSHSSGLAYLPIFAFAVLAGLPAIADDKDEETGNQLRATLSGFQEVPAISSAGQGEFRATIADQVISFQLTYSGLEGAANASHIHFGQFGVNGGVIAFLCGGGGKPACPGSGTVTGNIAPADILGPADQGIQSGSFAEAIRAIRQGATYVNIHTTPFPAGEIRGQIRVGKSDKDDDDDEGEFQGGNALCAGSLSGQNANVVVPEGAACALVDATVTGNVEVKRSGSLTISGKTVIQGNLESNGGAHVRMLGSLVRIGGNVHITKSAEWSGFQAGTQILGNLEYQQNSGALIANGGVIHGHLIFTQNTGGGAISGNTIHKNLECKQNDPAPTGSSNVVAGRQQGQCSGL